MKKILFFAVALFCVINFYSEAKTPRRKNYKKNITVKKNYNFDPNKHIVGSHGDADFFSEFFSVLNHIVWAKNNKKQIIVSWDKKFRHYRTEGYNGAKNGWEYYFYPLSKRAYCDGDTINRQFGGPDGSSPIWIYHPSQQWNPSLSLRYQIKQLLDRNITVKTPILKKLEDFYQQQMREKKTIGIHWFNTEEWPEIRDISPQEIFDIANQFSQQGYQFLVASDDYEFIDKARLQIKGDVIVYNYQRLPQQFYRGSVKNSYNMAQTGENQLIEALLLSRCEKLIHNKSNFSAAALCFNPHMEDIVIGEGLMGHVYQNVANNFIEPTKHVLSLLGVRKLY